MNLEDLYTNYKPLLFSIAYRMLGSVSDAEDVVQELFLSLQQLERGQIQNMKAYMTKMVTNRCLNILNSAKRNREIYVGPWLPEPLMQRLDDDPLNKLEREETISYAFLVMMDKLSPVERAVFILREAFQYEYSEIANILEKSEVNCRKIFSRVKQKVGQLSPELIPAEESEQKLVTKFISALTGGNLDALLSLLTEDAVFITDGGGKVRAAINPIFSQSRVMALLARISAKFFPETMAHLTTINGRAGVLLSRDGRPTGTICFEWEKHSLKIKRMYLVLNPDKLKHIQI